MPLIPARSSYGSHSFVPSTKGVAAVSAAGFAGVDGPAAAYSLAPSVFTPTTAGLNVPPELSTALDHSFTEATMLLNTRSDTMGFEVMPVQVGSFYPAINGSKKESTSMGYMVVLSRREYIASSRYLAMILLVMCGCGRTKVMFLEPMPFSIVRTSYCSSGPRAYGLIASARSNSTRLSVIRNILTPVAAFSSSISRQWLLTANRV